jgi:hypothetical protein
MKYIDEIRKITEEAKMEKANCLIERNKKYIEEAAENGFSCITMKYSTEDYDKKILFTMVKNFKQLGFKTKVKRQNSIYYNYLVIIEW